MRRVSQRSQRGVCCARPVAVGTAALDRFDTRLTRAYGVRPRYRHRNGIAQESVAMAVVVQVMVPAVAAGILFTGLSADAVSSYC